MSYKTDNKAEAGKHKFELAGLGLAPFRFVGCSENVINYPDGTSKAGGSCDYCGNGIRHEFQVRSADGKLFKVGCDCIAKTGDAGLVKAYKSSPEFRKAQAAKRAAKDKEVTAEIDSLLAANAALYATLPHPQGFTDRQTGQPLTALDQFQWLRKNCGASGRATLLRMMRKATA